MTMIKCQVAVIRCLVTSIKYSVLWKKCSVRKFFDYVSLKNVLLSNKTILKEDV